MSRTAYSTLSFKRAISIGILVGMVIALPGCGYAPVYGDKTNDSVHSDLSNVAIRPIEDRAGQQLRNYLFDLINPFGRPEKPTFFLDIKLSESKQGLAVRKSEIATRANLSFTANYSLTKKDGTAAQSGTSTIVTSYNILSSEYATLAAEKNARTSAVRELGLDISNRLAVYFQAQRNKK